MITAWVLIVTFWGDAITTAEFNTKERCEAAGRAIRAEKGISIVFVCAEK